MKEVQLLSKGLFEKPFMDSKVKTRAIGGKEKILGHLIGPLGLIFVVNTIAALVEKFFTQQTGAMYASDLTMSQKIGSAYEWVMIAAKILAVLTGILNGWLVEKTKSKQGRLRPWLLIFGFCTIAIGFLIFLFPGNVLGEAYWYYFFLLLIAFNTVGSSYFYFFRDTICSLTTRNALEKEQIAFIRKLSWTLISGIVIGMLINSVVLPYWLDKDINGYPLLLIGLSIVAIPLLLIEYYYTKERVTEDVKEEKQDQANRIPLKAQLKSLLTNKYYVLLLILTIASSIVDNFKGGNVQYFFIKFILGGNEKPEMYTLYQVITGVPLGLGAIIIYPLARKFSIKNITIVGFALSLCGSLLGLLFPTNFYLAFVAGFLRQLGSIPSAYILMTLSLYAFDDIEYKTHNRVDGMLGVALITALITAISAPFAGGYESTILKMGFTDKENVIPSEEIKNFMVLAFYLFDLVFAALNLIILPFVDIEKKMPQISEELLRRKKEACLKEGKIWIEPEEEERQEREKAEQEFEEARVLDLKDYCQKKNLDFTAENQKYLDKKAKKEFKAEQKRKRKAAKSK